MDSPRRVIQVIPDFPIPGPNNVSRIRCGVDDIASLVEEAREVFGSRGLRFTWILDPDVEPADLRDRLRAFGVRPDPHGEQAAAMILPAGAPLKEQRIDGLEIRDALESYESFQNAEWTADEAFGEVPFGSPSFLDEGRPRRFEHNRANPNMRRLLATIDGEPAGSASLALAAPEGAILNGGAVRPGFRGRGIYRAMVAARMRMIRDAGAAGAVVWAGDMSRPILETLGFQTVGWRKFYV